MFGLNSLSQFPFATTGLQSGPGPKPVPEVIPLWEQTLLSQYNSSPTIRTLIQSFNDAILPDVDIANFYLNIWNIYTAVGYGLDVWGKIVGVSRYLQISSLNNFGFDEAFTVPSENTGAQPFNQAPLSSGQGATNTYSMTDAQYRQLILVKAAANISDLSIPSINALLRAEFSNNNGIDPYGDAYVIDSGNMAFQYYLDFVPNQAQIAIITNSGVFPRPAGVQVTLAYV